MDKGKEDNKETRKIDSLLFMSPNSVTPIDRSSYKVIDFTRNFLIFNQIVYHVMQKNHSLESRSDKKRIGWAATTCVIMIRLTQNKNGYKFK